MDSDGGTSLPSISPNAFADIGHFHSLEYVDFLSSIQGGAMLVAQSLKDEERCGRRCWVVVVGGGGWCGGEARLSGKGAKEEMPVTVQMRKIYHIKKV